MTILVLAALALGVVALLRSEAWTRYRRRRRAELLRQAPIRLQLPPEPLPPLKRMELLERQPQPKRQHPRVTKRWSRTLAAPQRRGGTGGRRERQPGGGAA